MSENLSENWWKSVVNPVKCGHHPGADNALTGDDITGDIAVSNPATREDAFAELLKLLRAARRKGNRVLLGLDIAYGYPSGFAKAIGLEPAGNEGRWQTVWRLLHDLAFDPTVGGGDALNGMNKWAIGNELNRRFNSTQDRPMPPLRGPFWGRPDWTVSREVLNQIPANVRSAAPFAVKQRKRRGADRRHICQQCGIEPPEHSFLAMTSPGFPLAVADGTLQKLRRCEMNHRVQETWLLCGNGAVGGQTITGIPYLHRLLTAPDLAEFSQRVWPFTTGFADPTHGIEGPVLVHAEIFPTAVAISSDIPPGVPNVKDARQVWTLVGHARGLDAAGQFVHKFAPASVAALDEPAPRRLIDEEGWILFVD